MEKSWDLYPCFYPKKCSYGMRDDRISSLPVELLLIILSLLPLKEMVKTSILSRRWLKLWVKTPVLDFKRVTTGVDSYFSCNFVKHVNHVLQQHKGRYLKQFRICFNLSNAWREHIDRWLAFALARKVEILELDLLFSSTRLSIDYNYVFLDSWFISSGKANMDGGKSRDLQFNLKFLKSLKLKYVNVTNEAIYFLLRNSPFLERLELACNYILVDLVISDPTLALKHLTIDQCSELKVLSISNFNLVSLVTWVTSVKDLILQDLPMLVELSIWGYVNDLRPTVSQSATCLRQLKSLDLNITELKEFTTMLSILAQLTKLKRLVIRYKAKNDESLIVLLNVIKSCSNLEEFVLELTWISPKRLAWVRQKVERLKCERLKLVEFKGYYGRCSDYELLVYVVKNAPALEKIIIHPSNVVLRSLNCPVNIAERKARRHALEQIKYLKESKRLPPHIDVVLVEQSQG